MMKKYMTPEMNMNMLASEDILVGSSGYGDVRSLNGLDFQTGDIDISLS